MHYEKKLMDKVRKQSEEDKQQQTGENVKLTAVEKLHNLLGNSAVEAIMMEYAASSEINSTDEARSVPSDLREEYEQKYNVRLDDVKIHYDSDKPDSFNAYAYTEGNNVYLGPGQEKYLSHELNHVIQQKQDMVSANQYLNGRPVSIDPMLEAQADSGLGMNNAASSMNRQYGEGIIQLKSKNMRNSMHHFLDGIDINKTAEADVNKLNSLLEAHDQLIRENDENTEAESESIFNRMVEVLKMFSMMQEDRERLIEIAHEQKDGSNMTKAVEDFFDSIDLSMSSADDLSLYDEKFRQYDALGEDKVDECEALLMSGMAIVSRLNISNAGRELLISLMDKEMRDLYKPVPMKINPLIAYDHMASQGILWRLPLVADKYKYPKKGRIPDNVNAMSDMVAARVSGRSLPNAGINGFEFFSGMSRLNMQDTENLKSCVLGSNKAKKRRYDALREKIIGLLVNKTRISHYTSDDKFKLINRSNGIISKLTIEMSRKGEMSGAEHNTQSVDEYGYANTGFVFAYMEVDGAPPASNHRYGKLRISHKTKYIISMLESAGMIELFDIMQGAKETQTAGEERRNVESVRKSVIQDGPAMDKISEYLQTVVSMDKPDGLNKDQQRVYNEIMTTIIPQSMQLDSAAFIYENGTGSMTVPQMLHNNFFVGKDIILGLAAKAAMELIMLEDAGLAIPTDDIQLLRRILSGLYKIQVLLPGGMPLYGADIDRAN